MGRASYTQIKAYREFLLSGELKKNRDRIMRLFWLYEKQGRALCRQDIVKISGIPINIVSGRVAGLKQGGYLKVVFEAPNPHTKSPSAKTVEFLSPVREVEPTRQMYLGMERSDERV